MNTRTYFGVINRPTYLSKPFMYLTNQHINRIRQSTERHRIARLQNEHYKLSALTDSTDTPQNQINLKVSLKLMK